MGFSLLDQELTPAEGEITVRNYFCTTVSSRLLGLSANGYLTVTNKRVVFYASGLGLAGKSVLHSEVPIADVSGITSYKGTYFSLSHLLGALAVSFLSSSLTAAIGGSIITSVLLRDPRSIGGAQALLLVLGLLLLLGSFLASRESILRSVVAAASVALFGLLAGTGLPGSLSGGFGVFGRGDDTTMTILGNIAAIVAAIYTLVCVFWYSRRPTLSLAIGSKGGATTPIAISGAGFGLRNTAALQALTAEPAEDAERMIRELGAMIMDLQVLGDHGIRKWEAATSV